MIQRMFTMKKIETNWIYVAAGAFIISVLVFILAIVAPQNQDKEGIKAKPEVRYNCPYCRGTAELYQSRNGWYIECANENCGYRTTSFNSAENAELWWNLVFGGDETE